jgi:hypothetical protein
VPDTDTPPLLCSQANFEDGAFADLVSAYPAAGLTDVLAEATRKCEDETDRRLVPFTVTETVRADGIDPDEYAGAANLPMDIRSTLGMSYADALGVSNLVRHTWLAQYPVRYPDLWTTSPSMSVTVVRSYGGTEQLTSAQILDGPDDKGHVWFQLGMFIPVGSRLKVTYSGGYTVAIPATLCRASKYIAASLIIDELDPGQLQVSRNPKDLFAKGLAWLKPWTRDR